MNEIFFPVNFNFATNFYWPTNFWFTDTLTTSTGVSVAMRPIYMDIVGARLTWR